MPRRSAGLLFLPALLAAQAPAPLPLGQRLRTEGPEIQGLLTEFRAREAWGKAQGLIPDSVPSFDKANAWASYSRNRELVQAFFLCSNAAFEAGYWEKALELRMKAAEIAKVNQEESNAAFGVELAKWKATADQNRALLKEVDGRVAELRAKPSLEAGEKQELELASGIERDVQQADKNIQILTTALENAKKDLDYYSLKPKEVLDLITEQVKQLAEYQFKDDKEKWVEGAIANKAYLEAYPEKKDKLFVLYRLNVLSPENKKVLSEIDRLMGRSPEPEPTTKVPKKPGKKRK